MFDFILSIGNNVGEIEHYKKSDVFLRSKSTRLYVNKGITYNIQGLYRGELDSCTYENDNSIILIVGDVFYKNKYKKCSPKILPKEILKQIEADSDFLNKIKGDFSIILFLKNDNTVKVFNDQFALRPLYYGRINDEVIISNNLNLYKSFKPEINEVVLLEKLLFSYPITNETFFKNVFFLNGGEVLSFDGYDFKILNYFNLKDFVFKGEERKFKSNEFVRLFNDSVIQKAQLSEHNVASLTGGFDGRSIVSSLLKEGRDFSTYSFGKKGGENTKVPMQINSKIKVNYKPIYLDGEYEKMYAKHAREAVLFSDGLSFHERANYTYAFNKLSEETNYVLTGLIAGEILRPIHLKTDYINETYYRVFYNLEELDIENDLAKKGLSGFINSEFIERNKKSIQKKIANRQKEIKQNKSGKNAYLYYYYDLIQLGFRRFYGSEMHLERFYCTSQTPFFDFDILDYILNTKYKILFNNAFKDGLIYRWKGQKIYSQIFNLNYSEIGNIPVDRGYKPKHLLNTFSKAIVIFQFLRRRKRLKNSVSEFDTPRWSKYFFDELNKSDLIGQSFFNQKELLSYIDSYKENDYNQDINRLISLCLWVNGEGADE